MVIETTILLKVSVNQMDEIYQLEATALEYIQC